MIGAVAVGPEDRVGDGWGASPGGIRPDEDRVDVLPDDFLVGRHFKYPAGGALADQGVAVGKAFGAADIVAIERQGRLAGVLPTDLVGLRVNLDHPRVFRTPSVGAIIEQ